MLAGGGGKGAYQIGVLKALVETNLIDKIQVIAGTSVGALNAILYAHKNLALSEYIWLSRVEDKILYKDKRKLEQDWYHWKKCGANIKQKNDQHLLEDFCLVDRYPLASLVGMDYQPSFVRR